VCVAIEEEDAKEAEEVITINIYSDDNTDMPDSLVVCMSIANSFDTARRTSSIALFTVPRALAVRPGTSTHSESSERN
jgi:hypothetical protein